MIIMEISSGGTQIIDTLTEQSKIVLKERQIVRCAPGISFPVANYKSGKVEIDIESEKPSARPQ